MDIETMKVLCEPTRCRILMLLSKKAYCVSALASLLELSVPAVSQHLRLLRGAGLVISEKYSYQTHYRLDKEQIARVANGLLELAKDKPNQTPRLKLNENKIRNALPKHVLAEDKVEDYILKALEHYTKYMRNRYSIER